MSWVHRSFILETASRYRTKHDEDGEHAEVLKLVEATVDVDKSARVGSDCLVCPPKVLWCA